MDEHKKSELSELSRACKLQLSYIDIFFVQELSELKKQLGITAATIKSIINSFPITGQNNYAKTCRLHIQFVEKLKSINPSLYNQLQLGNHTVRSTGSYWSGIWMDLSIEQILMKPLKRISGIIGERITENVMYIWTKAIHMYSSFQ